MARPLGWALFGSSWLVGGWFMRIIENAGTPIRTDKSVPRLVTEGLFRYTRNPGYLGLAMFYAGIAMLRNSLWAILLLPFVVYVIGREERYLERTFGEEHLAY
ncbi:MAG TPA: methyltransferase [Rubrobacter sp.]